MTNLKNAMPSIKDDDIGWVITVPAIWNDTAKKFMRLAAKKVLVCELSAKICCFMYNFLYNFSFKR